MEGRDITTVVYPNADVKIFILLQELMNVLNGEQKNFLKRVLKFQLIKLKRI